MYDLGCTIYELDYEISSKVKMTKLWKWMVVIGTQIRRIWKIYELGFTNWIMRCFDKLSMIRLWVCLGLMGTQIWRIWKIYNLGFTNYDWIMRCFDKLSMTRLWVCLGLMGTQIWRIWKDLQFGIYELRLDYEMLRQAQHDKIVLNCWQYETI